jgi:3-dehydroquinate synthase
MAPLASTTSTSSSSSSGDIGTTTTAATTVTTMPPNDFFGCTTESFDNYDVVKVDLENDRDYPIYIGTGYSDEQGMRRRL